MLFAEIRAARVVGLSSRTSRFRTRTAPVSGVESHKITHGDGESGADGGHPVRGLGLHQEGWAATTRCSHRVARQVVVEDLVEGAEAAEPWLARGGDGLIQRRFGVGCGLALSAALTG